MAYLSLEFCFLPFIATKKRWRRLTFTQKELKSKTNLDCKTSFAEVNQKLEENLGKFGYKAIKLLISILVTMTL